MLDVRKLQSAVTRTRRPHFRNAASLLAIASVMGFASANAEEPAGAAAKSLTKAPAVHAKSDSEPAAIPECLQKLKLTSQQETQIKEINSKYDSSLATVWKQFSGRYMQAITMESSLLAAIEDNLTEQQRTQVHAQRHKTAHREATNEQPNPTAAKPSSAVEDDLAGVGVTLTSEQEASADKVHEKYRSQMRTMKRDIEGLHIRLVSLEADKMVAIEKVLTKEQLAELRTHRQNAPAMPKMAMKSAETTIKE